jgi:hypothetical protein
VAGTGETEDTKVTFTVPVNVPAEAGVNTTLMLQLAPAAIETQLLVCEKSDGLAPWMEIADTCTALRPTFERVMSCDGLEVPAVWLAKVRVAGVKLTTVQMPDSVMVCGLPPALSAIETKPVIVPLAAGANETEMVQLAPAARLEGQLLVWG